MQLLDESANQFCLTRLQPKTWWSQSCQACKVTESALLQRPNCLLIRTHLTRRANLTQTLPEYFPHYSQHQLLSPSRLVLVNKMQRERNHLFSGSCNWVVTDIPKKMALKALLRKLLGLGDIYQTITIYSQWFCWQYKMKQHCEYCNDFIVLFIWLLCYYN